MYTNGSFADGMALHGSHSPQTSGELHVLHDNTAPYRIPISNYGHRLWMMNGSWVEEDSNRKRLKEEDSNRKRQNNATLRVVAGRGTDDQDPSALLDCIKTCGINKDLSRGSRIHADILKQGLLQRDIYVSTALLRMYARFGLLSRAQELFDELPTQDVVAWNALIAGYAQHGLGEKALDCLRWMQDEGILPDVATFVSILKACGTICAADKGEQIHAEVSSLVILEDNIVLGTSLVDMYGKCGALTKAQAAFDMLPIRTVVSWNALITGYAQHGFYNDVLDCFREMQGEGLSPDAVTFVSVLKACGSLRASERGEEIHAEVDKKGLLRRNVLLVTALVDMYAKCGMLEKAKEVFDEFSIKDTALWNSLLAGYAQHGHGEKALDCFRRMQDEGFSPDEVTFVCVLQACGSLGATEKGEEIHLEIRRQGLLGGNVILGTALVDMYAKCGALVRAHEVFDGLSQRNVASWSALITGYAQHGLLHEALKCLEQMRQEGHSPNAITFVAILKVCGSVGAFEKGEEIHAEIRRQRLLAQSVVLGNALVDMYAKCGALTKAQEVFYELPARDTASWNSLISGYAEHGLNDQAVKCLQQMRDEGFTPDVVTFVCLLKACGNLGACDMGEEIHAEISRQGLLGDHCMLRTALVDMYAKCGVLARAQEVLDELPTRDIASWTALMAGYAHHGFGEEALTCFRRMQEEGLSPNAITFACILKACGSIGATKKGEELHVQVHRQGLLGKNIVLGNALVDMYGKCGALSKAQEVFEELITHDVISWTALIAGYAQFGKLTQVFESFHRMIQTHIEPNVFTFAVLLTACSHAGLVEEGQRYFGFMVGVSCIIPTLEHYICMVDLFSRAGLFDKARSMIEKVPPRDRLLLWRAMLGSCRQWANLELGIWAFVHAVQLDEKCPAAYVCMSNIYSASSLPEGEDEVKALTEEDAALTLLDVCDRI